MDAHYIKRLKMNGHRSGDYIPHQTALHYSKRFGNRTKDQHFLWNSISRKGLS